MIRRFFIPLIALALLAAACGDDQSSSVTSAAGGERSTDGPGVTTPEYLAFRDQAVACGAGAPPPATELEFGAAEDLGLAGTVTAVLSTSCGDITLELDADAAPATVNSFVFLAEQGYFDGTVSHRVFDGFMIQAGDPSATGRGGPGYRVPDELPAPGFVYSRGTVAMANAGPNTSGSQFFLMLADTPLPPAYSVFGTVTAGLEVMDAIADVPTFARTAGAEPTSPTETVYIESVTISR